MLSDVRYVVYSYLNDNETFLPHPRTFFSGGRDDDDIRDTLIFLEFIFKAERMIKIRKKFTFFIHYTILICKSYIDKEYIRNITKYISLLEARDYLYDEYTKVINMPEN